MSSHPTACQPNLVVVGEYPILSTTFPSQLPYIRPGIIWLSIDSFLSLAETVLQSSISKMARAHITQGTLQGLSEGDVLEFLGVPYAAPPTGDRRWHSPDPPATWEGIRNATSFGPICPQTIGASFDVRQATQSEDCLYLNVWTRSCDKSAKQPVMVWIHGGGNLGGAGSEDACDGTNLARKGATVVTFNYRLGAFGFLAHPEIGANFGVQDQIAALCWVQTNIAAFGGDPANVMIFGESAGAVAVRTLFACPAASGLFHRAVLQSAGFEAPAIVPSWSYDRAKEAAEALFMRLGTRDLSELRRVPTDVVKDASHALSGIPPPPGHIHTPANLTWMPVVDGDIMQEGFSGCLPHVPVMMGCVENEARYFLKPKGSYTHAFMGKMAQALYGQGAGRALESLESNGLTLYHCLDKLFTTAIFTEPALESARKFASLGHRVYYYHFNQCSPGAVMTNELAKHTAEIRYVFGNLTEDAEYHRSDVEISRLMQHAWFSFACDGVPSTLDGLAWPVYSVAVPLTAWIENELAIRPFPELELVSLLRTARHAAENSEDDRSR